MPKTKISEFSSTPANNTDIDSINIAEGCAPSGINDAIRELMAQLKDFQTGAVGDSFNGPVGTTTAAAGAFTTLAASSTVTLSGGTANGVAYLNGSKVVTSGSALTFDGTDLRIGASSGSFYQGSGLLIQRSGYSTVRFNDTAGTSAEIKYADSLGLVLESVSNRPVVFSVNASEQMRLTSTGLGIGTSSPAYKVSAVVGSGSDAFFADANNLSYSGYRIRAGVSGQQWAFRGGTNTMGLTDVTAGVDRVVVDLSGNLGLGVTPSAWSFGKAIEVGRIGSAIWGADVNETYFLSNAYYASGFKYGATGTATQYLQYQGQHRWYTAPSGTAGNAITFTQALTLDSSQNLLIGTTTTTGNGAAFLPAGSGSGMLLRIAKASEGTAHQFAVNSNVVGSIYTTASATTYNTSSDYRLKNITGPVTTSGAYIDSLNPVEGTWKADGSTFVGLIAHEVQEASRTQVATGTKDGAEMQAMDYSNSELIANLVAELKSVRKRLADAGI